MKLGPQRKQQISERTGGYSRGLLRDCTTSPMDRFAALKISVLSALCPDVMQQVGGNHYWNVHNVMSSLQQLLSLNHPHQHQQATFNVLLLAFFLVARRRSVKTE